MERRTFKCPHCSKSFHCSSHLTTHVRTHTGEKPYQCGQCPKSFALLGNLTAHVRTHTGEKPYTCKYCAKSFTQSTNLNVHMRVHTGERPYKCQRCQKAFKTSGALNGHAKSCWKFSDIVSKHLPGYRRSGTTAVLRTSAHGNPGSRGRGIGKSTVALGTERSRLSLPSSGTISSKNSSHAPNEINNSQLSLSGNGNWQSYRKKLSAFYNKKRMNLASLVHSKSVNRPLGTSSSPAMTAEVLGGNSSVASSSKRLDTAIKQEVISNALNNYTEPSSNQKNQPENQKTGGTHPLSRTVDTIVTWNKEMTPNKIISSNSSGFVNSSNVYNTIGTNSLSNTADGSFSSAENKNFTISTDFSQPPQVRSDKGSLTIDFNSASALSRNTNQQLNPLFPVMAQNNRVSGLLQVTRPTTTALDQARSSKLLAETSVEDTNALATIQSNLSLLAKGSLEKSVYIPYVPTTNAAYTSPNRSTCFGSDKIPLESPVVLPSPAVTSNQVMEKKTIRNYFSDRQLRPGCSVGDSGLNSTSDSSRTIKLYSKNLPYQKPNPSKISDNTYSSFVETSILEKVFKCRLCGMIFDRMNEFVSHMPLHEEDELLVCKFCELDFMTPLELVLHMKSHVLPQQLCELCDQMVLSTRFAAHLSMHAASMKKMKNQTRTFWCRFCDKTFNQQAYLDLHLRVHASQKPIHFNSNHPNTTVMPEPALSNQKSDGSISTQKVFSCSYCKKEFQNSKNLIIHIRSHAVSNPHKCKKCHQIFKNMITYNTHKRSCFQDQKNEPQEFFPSLSPTTATTITTSSDSAVKAIASTITAVSTVCPERTVNEPEATHRPNSLSNIGSDIISDSVVRPSSAPHSSSHISIQPNNISHPAETNALKISKSIENANQKTIPYPLQESQVGICSEEEITETNQTEIENSEKNSADDSIGDITELVIASVTGRSTGGTYEEKMECDKMSLENDSEKLDDSLVEEKKKCFLCSEEFLTKSALSQHLQCAHDTSELACRICGKTFAEVDECIEHVDYCKSSSTVQVKCEFCNDSFASVSDYKQHKDQQHGPSCSDVAKSNNQLIDKKDINLGNTAQKNSSLDIISCKICSKQFTKLYSLSVHMRTHHTQRSINLNKCRYCERTFTSMSHLYVHHMKAHDRSQSLRCKDCKKPFKNWTRLKTHLRTHTGEKPYQCQICPKSFSQHGNLTAHMRTHTGEKPYKCKHCAKSFTQSTNLNVHMRVHTNERPYQCHMCMSAFKTSGARNSHLRGCLGFKEKNKGSSFFRNRLRGRQMKRKSTTLKTLTSTPSGGSLLDSALTSGSSLEQDSASTSSSNQLRKSDTDNFPVNKKLLNSMEENPAALNAAAASSSSSSSSVSKSLVLQQLEIDGPKDPSEVNKTEFENDFQFTIESEVSDCNSKELFPTIQGFYRNQFCSDVPSRSESATFTDFPTHSDKGGTVQNNSQNLHSNINDDIVDILESHEATSPNSNSHQANCNSRPEHHANVNENDDVGEDDDDVIIAGVDSNTSHISTANISNKKETLDIAENLTDNFEEIPAGRFPYPDNSELQRSDVAITSTSLFVSPASSLSLNNYTPSQTGSQFAVTYNAESPSEPYVATEPASKISSQSVNSLYSDQDATMDQNLSDEGSVLFTCSKCCDMFTSASDYTEHMISHIRLSTDMLPSTSGDVNLQSNSSPAFDSLSSSMDQTYTDQQQQHLFKIQTTTMDQFLQSNFSDNNAEDSKTQLIQCKLCPKRFTKFYSLAVHMKTHSQQPQQQQPQQQPQPQPQQQHQTCKICINPDAFLTADDLNDHRKKDHCEFPCNFCNKICHSSSQLDTHLRTHTGEKPFCCPHCPKTFAVNCNLIAHVRIHTGEKPFRCQYCDKSFTQATNLNVHTRIHTGERPYNCNRCKRAFRTSSALKGHVKCCPV